MFAGAWLQTDAEGYIPYVGDKSDWTHWHIVLMRRRYSDQAPMHVEMQLRRSHQTTGRWISEDTVPQTRRIDLGNANDPRVRARLRTFDGAHDEPDEGNPKIIRELESAIEAIHGYAERCIKQGRYFDLSEVDRFIRQACEKPE